MLTVIINAYNSEEYISETLKSLTIQKNKSFRVLVIDNMSTDSTINIVENFKDVLDLKIISTPSFMKLYEARNFAVKHVSTEYLTFLDSDDKFNDMYISAVLSLIDNKEFDVLVSKVSYIDKFSNDINIKPVKKRSNNFIKALYIENFITISGTLIRASVFEKYKFPNSYNLIGDHVFWLDIADKVEILYVDAYLTKYRVHDTSTGNSSKGLWIKEMRRLYIRNFKKHFFILEYYFYILRCEMRNFFKRI